VLHVFYLRAYQSVYLHSVANKLHHDSMPSVLMCVLL